MTPRRGAGPRAAAAAALAALLLAGCGGSDEPAATTAASEGTTATAGVGTTTAPTTTAPADSTTDAPGAPTDTVAYERAGGVLCTAARDEAVALPQVQRDEGLTIEQARERAAANGRRFNAAFAELRPPADLRPAHERVLAFQREFAAAGSTTQVGRIIRLQQELTRRYEAAGQTTCARLMRESTLQLREAEKRTSTTTTGP